MVRLALLRFLLLPLYANWWMRQTCSSLFLLLFLLYITQMMNWAIYTLHINSREMQSIHISINNQTGYLEEDKLKMDKNTISTQIPETNEVDLEFYSKFYIQNKMFDNNNLTILLFYYFFLFLF